MPAINTACWVCTTGVGDVSEALTGGKLVLMSIVVSTKLVSPKYTLARLASTVRTDQLVGVGL